MNPQDLKKEIIVYLKSDKFKNSIKDSIPQNASFERLLNSTLQEITQNSTLINEHSEFSNIIIAIQQVMQTGLELGSRLGYAHILPNWKKPSCKIIIGYKGYLKLAYDSPKVSIINANTVDEDDIFEFQYGTNASLRHIPNRNQSNNIIYSYADIKFKDNSYHFEVLTRAELDQIKNCSEAQKFQSHPWNVWPQEMMKKSALRRLFKYVHISSEISNAAAIDDIEEIKPSVNASDNLLTELQNEKNS